MTNTVALFRLALLITFATLLGFMVAGPRGGVTMFVATLSWSTTIQFTVIPSWLDWGLPLVLMVGSVFGLFERGFLALGL